MEKFLGDFFREKFAAKLFLFYICTDKNKPQWHNILQIPYMILHSNI